VTNATASKKFACFFFSTNGDAASKKKEKKKKIKNAICEKFPNGKCGRL